MPYVLYVSNVNHVTRLDVCKDHLELTSLIPMYTNVTHNPTLTEAHTFMHERSGDDDIEACTHVSRIIHFRATRIKLKLAYCVVTGIDGDNTDGAMKM